MREMQQQQKMRVADLAILAILVIVMRVGWAGSGIGRAQARGSMVAPRAYVAATTSCPPLHQWSVVTDAAPHPAAVKGVAYVAANNVWAAGFQFPTSATEAGMIEHWDGTAWSVVTSPGSGGNADQLNGISAISANDIWAVGDAFSGDLTLIEHWDGTAWSTVASPNPGTLSNGFNAVSGDAANDVWAVGSTYNGAQGTLVARWNGTTWSVVPSTVLDATTVTLDSVVALAPNNVWVVGSNGFGPAAIGHWDGSKWTAFSPMGGTAQLYGIAAVNANDVWAVGSYGTTSGVGLAVHWDGTKWSVVSGPGAAPGPATLLSVAAISGHDVWAVGYYTGGPGPDGTTTFTLTQHWDGSSWTIGSSPSLSPTDQYDTLNGVAGAANDFWTGGSSFVLGSSFSSLVAHNHGLAFGTPQLAGTMRTSGPGILCP